MRSFASSSRNTSFRVLSILAVSGLAICSTAFAQRPMTGMDVTVVVGIQGDPATDCGVRGEDNPRFQSSARAESWNARACILPYPGSLEGARVIQMIFPSDRCTRFLDGPNRVKEVQGHELTVLVSLTPTTDYRFCLFPDDASPQKEFRITARPGRPYALPNERATVVY